MFDISARALSYMNPPWSGALNIGEPSSRPPISVAPSCVTCIIHRIRAPPSTVKCTENAAPSGCSTRSTDPRGATCARGCAASTLVPRSRPSDRAASDEPRFASCRSASICCGESSSGVIGGRCFI